MAVCFSFARIARRFVRYCPLRIQNCQRRVRGGPELFQENLSFVSDVSPTRVASTQVIIPLVPAEHSGAVSRAIRFWHRVLGVPPSEPVWFSGGTRDLEPELVQAF